MEQFLDLTEPSGQQILINARWIVKIREHEPGSQILTKFDEGPEDGDWIEVTESVSELALRLRPPA